MSTMSAKMLIDDNEFPSLPSKVQPKMKQTLLAPITKMQIDDPFKGLNAQDKKHKQIFLNALNMPAFHTAFVDFAEKTLCIRVKDASQLEYWAQQYCGEHSDSKGTHTTLFNCTLKHDGQCYGVKYIHHLYTTGIEGYSFEIKEHADACCGYSCGFYQCPGERGEGPTHHCGDRSCHWDCGVLWCGCIDICRGRCGLKDDDW